jgi:hypothetical protein
MAPTVSREVSHEATKARRIQRTRASCSSRRGFVPSCESCRHFLRGWRSCCCQILLRRRLVVVKEVAQDGEGPHGVAEAVRIHRPRSGLAALQRVLPNCFWLVSVMWSCLAPFALHDLPNPPIDAAGWADGRLPILF